MYRYTTSDHITMAAESNRAQINAIKAKLPATTFLRAPTKEYATVLTEQFHLALEIIELQNREIEALQNEVSSLKAALADLTSMIDKP